MPAVDTLVGLLTKYAGLASGAVYHCVVPPEVTMLLRFMLLPLQIVCAELLNVGVDGSVFTVIVEVAVAEHPFASVPVTVYVLVEVGVAITLLPVVEDNSVEGLQL